MPVAENQPTPFPDVNALLHGLLESVRAILGSHFIGMYLDGSLAGGGFDQDSDIDFVVVTDIEITDNLFLALQSMHDRIAANDAAWALAWAIQLEGSYLSKQALRRHDPTLARHPNIERGPGERLKLVDHGEGWNVHRSILWEKGIVLAGPAPQSLIDPVAPDQLRGAMRSTLSGWGTDLLNDPAQITQRGYQSYIVLSLCRILYTLEYGAVASKPAAAQWAQETLDARWTPLIERAWDGRHTPGLAPAPEDVAETLEFMRYTLERNTSTIVTECAGNSTIPSWKFSSTAAGNTRLG